MKKNQLNYIKEIVARMEKTSKGSFWNTFGYGDNFSVNILNNTSVIFDYHCGSAENVYFDIYLYDYDNKKKIPLGYIYTKDVVNISGGTPCPSLSAFSVVQQFIEIANTMTVEIFFDRFVPISK